MVRLLFTHILVVVFLLINVPVFAQKQVESVKRLSENINTEAEEILPLLSPTGDSLFFARIFHESNVGGKFSGSDIWLSTFDKSDLRWTIAQNKLKDWNDKRNNFIIGINPKERIIYHNNPKNPEKGIRFVKELNGNWTKLENISLEGIPNTGYQGLYVSPDYEVIIVSMKLEKGSGKEDLYIITKNNAGKWSKPISLGSTINTPESEISPFLSADKNTLYFASKGHSGYGDMDIYKAERLYKSWTVWSKPQNLGEKINSEAFDGYYSEYGDSLAYFSSNREDELSDIYEVKFKPIELQKSTTMPVVIGSSVSERIYLSQKEIKELLGFKVLQPIEVKVNSNISENEVARELIYFLSNKLKINKEVKLGITVSAHPSINTEQMVKTGSDIAFFIAKEMNKNGIPQQRIQYEGVTIENELYSNEIIFLVRFVFFK
ncbi:WD40-like Beta Propeller Repeat [Marivirga sericea]|uniref:WD40-like Beta Propeller Repeat n=1 Tax=Marivirga sericea TaxID=1028 RepID=A0A1X7KKQ4_9BACT|nr:PD40 domain-containing protein [Marivirga sericea]SMG41698.1 WD40-like Beta Propeller Repeat [Marivirga sericea]